ncbi:hypothetical protein JOM56_005178 [Amanita muscaria]
MLLNILQRCKSLVECTLLVNLQLEYGQPEHDIVLPNLESLVLHIYSADSADHIIRSLTLPNLKSLDITALCATPVNTEAIVTLAHRSGFKRLTHFRLCHWTQPVDVGSLLRSMSALKSVTLHSERSIFRPGILDDLSCGAIGPQLEEMKIGIMSDDEVPLMLQAVGQRHEKAKTVSDIRPFASIACLTDGLDQEQNIQRANQCGEAFNLHVSISISMHSFPFVDDDEEYLST